MRYAALVTALVLSVVGACSCVTTQKTDPMPCNEPCTRCIEVCMDVGSQFVCQRDCGPIPCDQRLGIAPPEAEPPVEEESEPPAPTGRIYEL